MSICLSTLSTATMSPCCLSPFHPYATNRVSVIWPDPAAWSADQGKDKFVEVCTAYFVVRLYRSSQTRHYAPHWSELSMLEARGATGQHICFFPLPHMLLQIYLYFHFQHLIILLPLLHIYLNFHFQHLQRLLPHSSGVGCEDSVFISCDDSKVSTTPVQRTDPKRLLSY